MDPNHPTTMLLPLAGILLILFAVWLTGGARRARLDPETVARRIAEDLPGVAIRDLSIGIDRAAGLATMAGGAVPIAAFAAGDKIVVRRLAAGDIAHVERRPSDGNVLLVIDTGDFTRGRITLPLPAHEAAAWEARLAMLAAPTITGGPVTSSGAA